METWFKIGFRANIKQRACSKLAIASRIICLYIQCVLFVVVNAIDDANFKDCNNTDKKKTIKRVI